MAGHYGTNCQHLSRKTYTLCFNKSYVSWNFLLLTVSASFLLQISSCCWCDVIHVQVSRGHCYVVPLPLFCTGTIHDEARQRQEEIRSKLVSVDARARPAFDQAKDYYTSEEAALFMKPKKKVGACLEKCMQSLHDWKHAGQHTLSTISFSSQCD